MFSDYLSCITGSCQRGWIRNIRVSEMMLVSRDYS